MPLHDGNINNILTTLSDLLAVVLAVAVQSSVLPSASCWERVPGSTTESYFYFGYSNKAGVITHILANTDTNRVSGAPGLLIEISDFDIGIHAVSQRIRAPTDSSVSWYLDGNIVTLVGADASHNCADITGDIHALATFTNGTVTDAAIRQAIQAFSAASGIPITSITANVTREAGTGFVLNFGVQTSTTLPAFQGLYSSTVDFNSTAGFLKPGLAAAFGYVPYSYSCLGSARDIQGTPINQPTPAPSAKSPSVLNGKVTFGIILGSLVFCFIVTSIAYFILRRRGYCRPELEHRPLLVDASNTNVHTY